MRVTELLSPDDCRINEALSLALRVFDEVEAPIYPPRDGSILQLSLRVMS